MKALSLYDNCKHEPCIANSSAATWGSWGQKGGVERYVTRDENLESLGQDFEKLCIPSVKWNPLLADWLLADGWQIQDICGVSSVDLDFQSKF